MPQMKTSMIWRMMKTIPKKSPFSYQKIDEGTDEDALDELNIAILDSENFPG